MDYKKRTIDIKGAELDNIFDDLFATTQALEYPDEKAIGLVIFERNKDYLIMDHSLNTLSDSIDMSHKENESIKKLLLRARAGAAGGMVFPQTNSHSLSSKCRSNNSKLITHKKGVGVSCKYINKNGEVKEFKSVYNDMFMYRINCRQKLKMLLCDETFRKVTIKEMTSRIQSYLIA